MCSWGDKFILVQTLDKLKYTPYISVTHKVLKSRSEMATLAYDVCDVHGVSLLYIKTCWQG